MHLCLKPLMALPLGCGLGGLWGCVTPLCGPQFSLLTHYLSRADNSSPLRCPAAHPIGLLNKSGYFLASSSVSLPLRSPAWPSVTVWASACLVDSVQLPVAGSLASFWFPCLFTAAFSLKCQLLSNRYLQVLQALFLAFYSLYRLLFSLPDSPDFNTDSKTSTSTLVISPLSFSATFGPFYLDTPHAAFLKLKLATLDTCFFLSLL